MPSPLLAILERYRSFSTRQKIALVGAISFLFVAGSWGIYYSAGTQKVIAEKIASSEDREDIIRVLDNMGIDAHIDGDRILVKEEVANRAAQALMRVGLPRTSRSMAEAMRQIPFGTTAFHEQVVEAEARQNELAGRIEEMEGVRRARVIINIPKPSVFLRDEVTASAAVTIYMHKGFMLEKDMVRSVASIVAAAGVPEDSVRVIDGRTGRVASTMQSKEGLNNTQLEYIDKIKHAREEDIVRTLLPITGQGRVSATVSVDVDFSRTEQTSENFKPNPLPAESVIRSQHIKEGTSPSATAGGVPGALSNQPPGAASAPLVAPGGTGAVGGASTALINAQRESVVNYEVDKTIRHTRGSEWAIKRVTASVVVNVDPDRYNGKDKNSTFKSKEDFDRQVNDLIKAAIGFDDKRGDTIQVVNTPFAEEEPLPIYKNPRNIALVKDILIHLLWGGIILYLVLGVIRPMFRYLFAVNQTAAAKAKEAKVATETVEEREAAAVAVKDEVIAQHEEAHAEANAALQRDLDILDHERTVVQSMIRQDPRMAAEILKQWMSSDE
ncbi:MAG: flagellar basal-body MS-ring/collar protein FliF [Pseudomonadota bacterium]